MQKTVYVIGHKNPDTDSIVAALAYAEFKRTIGMAECRAAHAGAVNPQTEYILDRFGVELPVLLHDLVPKVQYFFEPGGPSVPETVPLWEALGIMSKAERKVLPIVDREQRYRSTLHYGAFAENMLGKINPRKKAVIPTSVGQIVKTIQAQPLVTFSEEEPFRARIVVAALETGSFRNT